MQKKQLISIHQKERIVLISSINYGDEKIYRTSSRTIDHANKSSEVIEELITSTTYDDLVSTHIHHVSIVKINNSTSVKYRGYWIFDHDRVEGERSKVVIVTDKGQEERATIARFADDIDHALDIIDESLLRFYNK